MNQVICPHCGESFQKIGLAAGETVVCPVCNRVLQVWGDADAPCDSRWSNPVGGDDARPPDVLQIEQSAARTAHQRAESSGSRGLILGLLGLIVFLIALIGAVLAARQLRPVIASRNLPPEPVTLDDWIRQLDVGPGKPDRLKAAQKIAGMGPEAVIAALDATTVVPADASMLDISPAVIHALAAAGPGAVPALCEGLSSEKQNVRAGAARVLREMGSGAEGAVTALAGALKDDNRWVRWYAIETLGNLGPDAASALDALVPLLDHPDRYTRRRAVRALGQIGPAAGAAVPELARVQKNDKDYSVRRAATAALLQVNLAEIVAESASQANPYVQDLIKQLRGGDQYAAVAAAKSLGNLGRDAQPAVPALIQALRSPNKWLREAAAGALGALGRNAPVAAPALKKLLQDESAEVRAAAEEALKKIEQPGS